MGNRRWHRMDEAAIRLAYEQEKENMAVASLQGASWREMKERHNTLTELSLLLYQRISGHPAGHRRRNSPERNEAASPNTNHYSYR